MWTTSRVWRVLPATVGLTWFVLLLATPSWRGASSADGWTMRATVAVLVDVAASRVCHRRPDRSFLVGGQPVPVCGRCTGLYVAGATGLIAAALAGARRPGRRGIPHVSSLDGRLVWLLAAGLPTVLTWTLEVVGVWNPGTPLRALAALPLGLTVGWIVGGALGAPRPAP
ncbi:MAG TPA: DUF2085 domain-containing protein [Luteitalea sp.]|nr:DUF2085 domain-containing protein [Luteitalea sp.]